VWGIRGRYARKGSAPNRKKESKNVQGVEKAFLKFPSAELSESTNEREDGNDLQGGNAEKT